MLQEGCRLDRPAVERQIPGIGQSKRPQVVNQMLQMAAPVVHDVECFRRRFQAAGAQGLHVAQDNAKRRSQVMGDVGRHLSPLLVRQGQVGAHTIK